MYFSLTVSQHNLIHQIAALEDLAITEVEHTLDNLEIHNAM